MHQSSSKHRSQCEPSSSSSSSEPSSSSAAPAGPSASSPPCEDPVPGPSNSAADFDLEVFDSGSSCSLEECCWRSERKLLEDLEADVEQAAAAAATSVPGGGRGGVHEEEGVEVCLLGHEKRVSSSPPCTSLEKKPSSCLSETDEEEKAEEEEEEDVVDDDHSPLEQSESYPTWTTHETHDDRLMEGLLEEQEEDMEDEEEEEEEEVCECPPASSAGSALLWIEEIVRDHDNFGTHENEDSLDASSTAAAVAAGTAAPTCQGGGPSSLPSHKRKSGEPPASRHALESECPPLHKKPCVETHGTLRRKWDPRARSSPSSNPSPTPPPENPPSPRELQAWLATFGAWNGAERLLALDSLIDSCDPSQVRHMMQVIEPQFQRDFISLLPKELALYVLSFLDPRDLLRAAQTCRYWRVLAEDNLLWREKCREAGLKDVRDMLNKRRKMSSSFIHSAWKTSYMRQHNIEMNWRVRPIRPPKVLKGHDDHVITCLQFSNNRIVSGSDDNTLKVWSATTGKCLRTLMGHTGGVWSSQMRDNIIVSGSTDRSLKVWNADAGTCVHTLYGHTSTVRCMHLHENQVVSGSRDSTLRIWDIETGECLHILAGHLAAVRCVQYDGRLVVSGAYDYMVKVWNPEREECLHTLSGHTNRVYSLQFDGVHVVSGSLDTSIRVWDVETGACKHALMGHQSLTSGMELRNNILVSGNADSTVKVWDITNGQCLQTLSGHNKHQSAVTCLQFNSKFVITSSDDGTVKLWDVKTGEFVRDLVALESGGSGGVVWRIRANPTKLVCAVGSRNGTEETKLLVLDFDANDMK